MRDYPEVNYLRWKEYGPNNQGRDEIRQGVAEHMTHQLRNRVGWYALALYQYRGSGKYSWGVQTNERGLAALAHKRKDVPPEES